MKSFYRISVLSLLLLACNVVKAQEVTLDFTSNDGWNFPTEATIDEGSFTKDGITIKLDGVKGSKGYYFATASNETFLFAGSGGGHIYFPQFDFDVEKIELQTPKCGRSGLNVTLEKGNKEQDRLIIQPRGKVTTINVSDELKAATGLYDLKFNSGAQLANIKVYKATPTAIKEINATKADADTYYTLDGLKVSHPTKKGIYIKNGKKVVVEK